MAGDLERFESNLSKDASSIGGHRIAYQWSERIARIRFVCVCKQAYNKTLFSIKTVESYNLMFRFYKLNLIFSLLTAEAPNNKTASIRRTTICTWYPNQTHREMSEQQEVTRQRSEERFNKNITNIIKNLQINT